MKKNFKIIIYCEDILSKIVKFLSIKDIFNLSSIDVTIMEIFNNQIFWLNYLPKKNKYEKIKIKKYLIKEFKICPSCKIVYKIFKINYISLESQKNWCEDCILSNSLF